MPSEQLTSFPSRAVMEQAMPLAHGQSISVEDLLKKTLQSKSASDYQFFFPFIVDILYRAAIRPNTRKLQPELLQGINELIEDEKPMRDTVLNWISDSEGKSWIPFPSGDIPFEYIVGDDFRWAQFGRSLAVTVRTKDGSPWNIVFKGVPAFRSPSQPFVFAPHCISISRRQSGPGIFLPQPSWVLRGGESFHAARNQILLAYAVRAAASLFGEDIESAYPIALCRLESIPTKTSSEKDRPISVSSYFGKQLNNISRRNLVRLLRFLRIDMEDNLTQEMKIRLTSATLYGSVKSIEQLLFKLLEVWRPAVYIYAVKGFANARLEERRVLPELGIRENLPISPSRIRRALGFQDDLGTEIKVEIAKRFALHLSRIGYYHGMGGDLGSWQSALSPKDVTVHGAVLDLHPGMLAGCGDLLHHTLIFPIRRRRNTMNARESVKHFCRAMELGKGKTIEVERYFVKNYETRRRRAQEMR